MNRSLPISQPNQAYEYEGRAMFSHLQHALHGLFAETISHFPSVQAALPAGLSFGQLPESVVWANAVASQGKAAQPYLSQHGQRITTLASVFQPQEAALSARRYVPLSPLSLDTLLPQAQQSEPHKAYSELIDALIGELKACQSLPLDDYLVSANDILRRYTWCLPSPYFAGKEPDVSLYDHSRVVAALAPCYQADAGKNDVVATFISGDISGIQDFIYTITARGATPGLRGRSFYLQLLTEAIARYLLRELGDLPPTSILYASGGHFYLLAPGDQTEALALLRQKVSQKLLKHHRDLYVGLGCTALTQEDFKPEQFPNTWRRLGQDMSKAKNRRFHELGTDLFAEIFQPTKSGGEKEGECRVCHYEWSGSEKYEQDDERLDDEGDPIRKCQMCVSFEKLGNNLRNARYVHWRMIEAKDTARKDWEAVLASFGAEVAVYSSPEKILEEKKMGEIWAFSDEALTAVSPYRHRFPIKLSYIVNVAPTVTQKDRDNFLKAYPDTLKIDQPRPDTVKSFTLLEAQAKGLKRLGILRMDVDDLGKIFQQGFGKNSGLVQSVALSATVSLFFEGWLARLLAKIDPENRDVLYSIYSGGDDLFIVGAWDLLPALAQRIASDWQDIYAAGNPELHVSAGITIHGSKYPLYQAARAAESALEAAKDYIDAQENKKNAFTFLGRTFSWPEFREILNDKTVLSQLVEGQKEIGRSLLHHILRLDAMYHAHVKKQIKAGVVDPTIYWGRGQWLHVYQMSRLAGRLKGEAGQEARQSILEIRDNLKGEHFTHIHVLGLSARWAELETRHEREATADGDTEI